MALPDLDVIGKPFPKGSMIPAVTKAGRPFMRHDNDFDLSRWTGKIIAAALTVWRRPRIAEPMAVSLAFRVPVPSREYHEKDLDKLARAVLDALTLAAVYDDDKRVALLLANKVHLGPQFTTPGVHIRIARLTDKELPAMIRAYMTDAGLATVEPLTLS